MIEMDLQPGDEVLHVRFGSGTIEYPKEQTAIVRFEHGLEECELGTLKKLSLIHISEPTRQ